jgi:hypothetical protein
MKEVLRAMLMTKLKIYVATALLAVLLGASGLAFRAAGQAPQPAARPLTDLEVLRREVEILKLQMEVMQAKVRAQEAELRRLRGQVKAPPSGEELEKPVRDALRFLGEKVKAADAGKGNAPLNIETKRPDADALWRDTEDALKALREAKDDAKRQRLVEVLELLLRDLRRRSPKADAPRDSLLRPVPGGLQKQ